MYPRCACYAGRVGNVSGHGYPPSSIGFNDVLGFSDVFVAFATSLSTTSPTLLGLPDKPIVVAHPSRHSPLFSWFACVRSRVLCGGHNVGVPRLLDVLNFRPLPFYYCEKYPTLNQGNLSPRTWLHFVHKITLLKEVDGCRYMYVQVIVCACLWYDDTLHGRKCKDSNVLILILQRSLHFRPECYMRACIYDSWYDYDYWCSNTSNCNMIVSPGS